MKTSLDQALPVTGFRPEKVLFPPGGVNLWICLRGVLHVRLRVNPRFPCQEKKSPLSNPETASFSPGVSGRKLTSYSKYCARNN
jgi:hypothetical protein